MSTLIIINKYFLSILISLLFIQEKNNLNFTDKIKIEKDIQFNKVFKEFDSQKECLNFNEKFTKDSLMKKSSNVIYRDRKDQNLEFAKMNNCRSQIENGTVNIRIGLFNGFGGSGFLINCKNKKFKIKPFLSFCTPENRKQKLTIIQQELVLNKQIYKVGDSIFGSVKFKIIEKDIYGTNEHNAIGYFRTEIK